MRKTKFIKSIFQPLNSYFMIHNSNSGFAFVAIILIVVLLFSIMLVSGASEFQLSSEGSNNPPSDSSNPQPTATQSATATPPTQQSSPTPTPDNSNWSISYSIGNCTTDANGAYLAGVATATGDTAGYVQLETDNNGTTQIIETRPFINPTSIYDLTLKNSDGLNQNPWSLSIFEGGSQTSSSWAGGTLRSTTQGNPTGC